jgi:hypothetical protein
MRTVAELLTLQRAGLLEPDTDRDWTDDESALLKAAYRAGLTAVAELFPAEAAEVDDE